MNLASIFTFTLVLLTSALLAASPESATPTPPQPPPGPYIKRAPDFSQWQVVFSYRAQKAPSDIARPQGVAVIKTKPIWEAILAASDGTRTEGWGNGKARFIRHAGKPAEVFMPTLNPDTGKYMGSENEFVYCYDKTDFPDFDWLSASTFIGYDKTQTYLVFREPGSDGATAWIDDKTRLPARWQKGDEVRQFVFGSAPTVRLTLPQDMAQILANLELILHVSNWTPGAH